MALIVSVDATGGLTSDPLRQDSVATTAAAPVVESEQVTGAAGPRSGPGPAGESAIQSAERATDGSGGATGDTAAGGAAEEPLQLAAAAPAAPPSDQPVQEETAGVEPAVSTFGADATPAPLPTSAPSVQMTAASQDEAAKSSETAEAPVAVPAPAAASAPEDGPPGDAAREPGPTGPSPEPLEPAVPEPFTEVNGGTSAWWRVSEVVAGVLAVAFLAGLALRWRSGRREMS